MERCRAKEAEVVHKAGHRGPVPNGMVWVAEYAKAVRRGFREDSQLPDGQLIGNSFDLDLGERIR